MKPKPSSREKQSHLNEYDGDTLNLMLAAAAFNCRKWRRAFAKGLLFALVLLCGLNRQKTSESIV